MGFMSKNRKCDFSLTFIKGGAEAPLPICETKVTLPILPFKVGFLDQLHSFDLMLK